VGDQGDSVKVVTDDGGLPVTHSEYLPYGELLAQEGNECNGEQFNSQAKDKESGFYFYNARHYDGEIARFVTADSVVDGEDSLAGWNRYMYCGGNPVLYKDPSGHKKRNNIKEQVFGKPVGDRSLSSSDKAHSVGSVKRMDARMARNARDLNANIANNKAEAGGGIPHLINAGINSFHDYNVGSRTEWNEKHALNNIVIFALNKGLKNALKNKSLKLFNVGKTIENIEFAMHIPKRSNITMFRPKKPDSFKYYALWLDKPSNKDYVYYKAFLRTPEANGANKRYIKNVVIKFFGNDFKSLQNVTKKQQVLFNDLKKMHNGLKSGIANDNNKKLWMYHTTKDIDSYINSYEPYNNFTHFEKNFK